MENQLHIESHLHKKSNKFSVPQYIAQRKEDTYNGSYFADNRLDYDLNTTEKTPNNTGLPDVLKSGIENISGYAMDDVKVNYNSDKPAQLNAHAYAQGTDIHLGSGQEKHLPHEAWHVVQQKQGRVESTVSIGGAQINDNESLEKEADVMGTAALQMRSIGVNDSENLNELPKDTGTIQRNEKYQEDNKYEKAKVVGLIAGQKWAGMSGDVEDYTWHHIYPHSRLSEGSTPGLKDSRDYIALGPNSKLRIDDPGNSTLDPNYMKHGEGKPEIMNPLSKNLLEKHKELRSFDSVKTNLPDLDEIEQGRKTKLSEEQASDISIDSVIEDWSQWYVPSKVFDALLNEGSIVGYFNSVKDEASYTKLTSETIEVAIASLRRGLESKLASYKTVYKNTGKSSGEADDNKIFNQDMEFQFESEEETGVPLPDLAEAGGIFSGDYQQGGGNELWHFFDSYLKTKKNWLSRGSMGGYLNPTEKRKYDLSKLLPELTERFSKTKEEALILEGTNNDEKINEVYQKKNLKLLKDESIDVDESLIRRTAKDAEFKKAVLDSFIKGKSWFIKKQSKEEKKGELYRLHDFLFKEKAGDPTLESAMKLLKSGYDPSQNLNTFIEKLVAAKKSVSSKSLKKREVLRTHVTPDKTYLSKLSEMVSTIEDFEPTGEIRLKDDGQSEFNAIIRSSDLLRKEWRKMYRIYGSQELISRAEKVIHKIVRTIEFDESSFGDKDDAAIIDDVYKDKLESIEEAYVTWHNEEKEDFESKFPSE